MGFIGNIVGDVVGGLTGAKQAAKGAQAAAQTQASAADRAIAEQRSARLDAQDLQKPYVDAGSAALAQQMALLGLNGTAQQQTALSALLASPTYTTAVQQGEEAILANASATGGLRGGNVQNSLSRYRGDLLSSVLADQMARLGSVTSIGQNAAAGVGNAGMATANNVSNLLQQQGANLAGGQIAKGNMVANNFQNMLDMAGAVKGF